MNHTGNRALLSVYNKSGIVECARFLSEIGLELVSSGGTAAALREARLPVQEVSKITGFPELLDGRVKTLHPVVHAGILARREREDDIEALAQHGITPVDWVVVNLYPFEEELSRPKSESAQLEFIDIGGPTLLRAAAKNFRSVVVVTDPRDYEPLQREWREEGEISVETRRRLAQRVFDRTAEYDGSVAAYLSGCASENG
ncbi:MAG: IMP cyclohydrolase [Spirochaetaceae bacterium]